MRFHAAIFRSSEKGSLSLNMRVTREQDLNLPFPFDPFVPNARGGNLTGQRFGGLIVYSMYGQKDGTIYWLCRCDCGGWAITRGSQLRRGTTIACGCRVGKSNRKHGSSFTSEYQAYSTAKCRCTNPQHKQYASYGGRGIEFKFDSFMDFYTHMGDKPSSRYSLDRIDNDGHYEVGNVRWATRREQSGNRRCTVWATLIGRTQRVTEWAREAGQKADAFRARLFLNWCDNCILTLPRNGRCPHGRETPLMS
jgi:hypothetical protein